MGTARKVKTFSLSVSFPRFFFFFFFFLPLTVKRFCSQVFVPSEKGKRKTENLRWINRKKKRGIKRKRNSYKVMEAGWGS